MVNDKKRNHSKGFYTIFKTIVIELESNFEGARTFPEVQLPLKYVQVGAYDYGHRLVRLIIT